MEEEVLDYAQKVYLVLKRRKTTLFFVASEIDQVVSLKTFLSKILKFDMKNIRLTYQDRELYNTVRLFEYGISPKIALPHSPAVIGIQLRKSEKDKFERLEIIDNTTTPTPEQLLPMKDTDSYENKNTCEKDIDTLNEKKIEESNLKENIKLEITENNICDNENYETKNINVKIEEND